MRTGVVVFVALAGCGPLSAEPISRGEVSRNTLSDGLVGYWKLDEATADEPVVDSSGLGHDGVAVNAPSPSSVVAPVKIPNGSSRAFDGVNQYIDLGNPEGLGFAGAMSLAVWVKLSSIPETCAVLLSHGYRYTPHREVALRAGRLTCTASAEPPTWAVGTYDGPNHFAEAELSPAEVGAWVHLVGTYDGQRWLLYRNGAEVAEHVTSVGPSPFEASWGIGGRVPANPVGQTRVVDGLIDEVRVYARALSPAEVLNLYNL